MRSRRGRRGRIRHANGQNWVVQSADRAAVEVAETGTRAPHWRAIATGLMDRGAIGAKAMPRGRQPVGRHEEQRGPTRKERMKIGGDETAGVTSASPVEESQEEADMRAAIDEARAEPPREASASPARAGGGEQEDETDTRMIEAWIDGTDPMRPGQWRSGSHRAERHEQRAMEQSRRKGTPSLDAAAGWTRGDGRGARRPWESEGAERGEGEGPENSR